MRQYFLFILLTAATSTASESIAGRILDNKDQAGLEGVCVQVTIASINLVDSVWTDAEGEWRYPLPATMVEDGAQLPGTLELWANYPNPFTPSTTISLRVPGDENVRLSVYNSLGQEVCSRETFLPAGFYQVEWQSSGAAGVYFYVLRCGPRVLKGKMIQLHSGNGSGLGRFVPAKQPLRSPLDKTTSGLEIRLVADKFAYWPDTLTVNSSDEQYIITALQTVHEHAILMDLHNDILERMLTDTTYHLADRHTRWHTDVPRLRQGGMDLQFFVVWVDPTEYAGAFFETALHLVEVMKKEELRNEAELQQITGFSELMPTLEQHRTAYVLALEGGHAIENNLENLYRLYHLGVRYLTVTWNNSTDWAISAQDSRSNTVGLSEFGKKVIRACDSLGIMIDVSHVGKKTIEDILAVSRNPIIASHSGARALRDHYRNLDDDQILAIAERGGVIGVVFYPSFIVAPGKKADIQSVVAHIDYIARLAGIDCVALGSDFDGFDGSAPKGLEDTSCYPALTLALLQKGYRPQDVEKILGGNALRVWRRVNRDN